MREHRLVVDESEARHRRRAHRGLRVLSRHRRQRLDGAAHLELRELLRGVDARLQVCALETFEGRLQSLVLDPVGQRLYFLDRAGHAELVARLIRVARVGERAAGEGRVPGQLKRLDRAGRERRAEDARGDVLVAARHVEQRADGRRKPYRAEALHALHTDDGVGVVERLGEERQRARRLHLAERARGRSALEALRAEQQGGARARHEAVVFERGARAAPSVLVRLRRAQRLDQRGLDGAAVVRGARVEHLDAVRLSLHEPRHLLVNAVRAELHGDAQRLRLGRALVLLSIPRRAVRPERQ